MIARIQNAARRVPRGGTVSLAILVAAALAAIILAVLLTGRDGIVTDDAGKGGGADPPAKLIAVRNSLPLYPGANVDEAAVSTGLDLRESYWIPDEPKQVIAFYERELTGQGWKVKQADAIVGDKKDDGTQVTVLSTTFVKDDLLLIVSVVPNEKDPKRGASYLHLLIQPAK